MKVPTTGTSVFEPQTTTNGTLATSIPFTDALLNFNLGFTGSTPAGWQIADRLRGFLQGFPSNSTGATTSNPYLVTSSTNAESAFECRIGGLGVARAGGLVGSYISIEPGVIASGFTSTAYWFKRAPSFFDVVCYTGTGAVRTVTHNLTVVPELMIVKKRDSATASFGWAVWNTTFTTTNQILILESTDSVTGSGAFNSTPPSASVFTVGSNIYTNLSGSTYVAYLFASCPGVSKVGSFTGTGATQVINCGFTGGARFVLIKSTSISGDWYVWDSARGIVAGNDPYLRLNSAAAEVTGTDWVDTAASGFELSNAGGNLANSSGVSYIFLAIA
jgi:hypothetical protein